jgi:hypothetical protein
MWHVTFWLVSNVQRGPRRAARSGHDVVGPGLDKDLPESRVAPCGMALKLESEFNKCFVIEACVL